MLCDLMSIVRSSFKGYTYQHFVSLLLISVMDVSRNIEYIEAEIGDEVDHNFDDSYIKTPDSEFFFQIKNIKSKRAMIKKEDITIEENHISISGQKKINFDPNKNNILIINTDKIETNTEILDFDALLLNDIYIVPLTSDKIIDLVEDMYSEKDRLLQICFFAYDRIINEKFKVPIGDLPEFVTFSTKLEEETIILHEHFDDIDQGILMILGKPGVGKSHYVAELEENINPDVMYRFWIGSQDQHKNDRLNFKNFLIDMGKSIFNSPKSFERKELVDKINSEQLTIVIDGLDHVENYRPSELNDFVDFINEISEAKILIFSRPLRTNIEWDIKHLENWFPDQTTIYLKKAHRISEYKVLDEIYEKSKGYPIIVNFLAKHYILHNNIPIENEISEINEYYGQLIDSNQIKGLSLFLTNDFFFRYDEIHELLNDELLSDLIFDFMKDYPYLFKIESNRISLIHDSFNTFLRGRSGYYLKLNKRIIPIVMNSIENLEINYMSRIDGFNFSDKFMKKIIVKYCDIQLFEKLCEENFDIESLRDLYKKLKNYLSNFPNLLDIYQYYSFILILLIVERNDLIGYHDIFYQLFLFMDNNGMDENSIYSNGILWKLYQFHKYDNHILYQRFIEEQNLGNMQIDEVIETFENEDSFFNVLTEDFDEDNFFATIEERNLGEYEKKKEITEAFVRIKINNNPNSNYLDIIDNYLTNGFNSNVEQLINSVCRKFDVRTFFAKTIMSRMKYRLSELGVIVNDNIFLEKNLKEIIETISPEGSFEVHSYLLSFMRLTNHEGNDFNINEVGQFFNMYYSRKDYTVSNIHYALLVFENKSLIDELDSFELIESLMNQSEKGIRELSHDYLSKKEPIFIDKLLEKRDFDHDNTNIFNLSPSQINYFTLDDISIRLNKVFEYNMHGDKKIKYYDVCNVFKSKFGNSIRDQIKFFRFSLENVPSEEIDLVSDINYTLIENTSIEPSTHIPFENGYISKEDIFYIKEQDIKSTEIAKYTDAWYHCFPYMNLYEHYDKNELIKDCLEIIFISMFAKSNFGYFGNWNYFLGNIPVFLEMIDYNVKWEDLFKIFVTFLRLSSIPLHNHH